MMRMAVWLPNFLHGHEKVQQVFYPGLAEHPHHELAKRQQHGFGSMISMELGSLENANRVCETRCGWGFWRSRWAEWRR